MTIRYDRVLGASARPVGAESGYPVPGPQNVTSEESATAAFFTSSCAWQSVVSQDFDVIVVGTGATAVAFVDQALKNVNVIRGDLVIQDLCARRVRGQFSPEHEQPTNPKRAASN